MRARARVNSNTSLKLRAIRLYRNHSFSKFKLSLHSSRIGIKSKFPVQYRRIRVYQNQTRITRKVRRRKGGSRDRSRHPEES